MRHHRSVFTDREEAGRRLAEALEGTPADVVLGIARGGVIVAAPIAAALGAHLDVVLPRKLAAPGNPELGIGAVAPGVRVIDEWAVRHLRIPAGYLDEEVARQETEMHRRAAAYRDGRPAPEIAHRSVIVIDDGVATGITAVAALRWVRGQGARHVTFAAPVGSPSGLDRLRAECDDLVVLSAPASFLAVGEFYADFSQTSDEEVRAALAGA
jgi:putative phosphoribosyl transferase